MKRILEQYKEKKAQQEALEKRLSAPLNTNYSKRCDLIYFNLDSHHDANDVYDFYYFVWNRDEHARALAALIRLNSDTATAYRHLFNFFGADLDVANADSWCTGDLLSACLHPECSGITAADKVHVMRMSASQTVHYEHDEDTTKMQFAKRMGIVYGQQQDRTVFCAESSIDINAVVLPFHSQKTSHWSLLAFYRDQPHTATWSVMHYDSLGTCNVREALVFLLTFESKMKAIEPDFCLSGKKNFRSTPQQNEDSPWTCGYRAMMAALVVVKTKGDREKANEFISSDEYTNQRACADYLAECLQHLFSFSYLSVVRDRCTNLVDFNSDTKSEQAASPTTKKKEKKDEEERSLTDY